MFSGPNSRSNRPNLRFNFSYPHHEPVKDLFIPSRGDDNLSSWWGDDGENSGWTRCWPRQGSIQIKRFTLWLSISKSQRRDRLSWSLRLFNLGHFNNIGVKLEPFPIITRDATVTRCTFVVRGFIGLKYKVKMQRKYKKIEIPRLNIRPNILYVDIVAVADSDGIATALSH